MKTIVITLQERWESSKKKIHKNKKKYDRKSKSLKKLKRDYE